MDKTLYIDVDSTIWPAEKAYNKAAHELYGVDFGDDWYSVDELVDKFGPDYRQIFDRALDPLRIFKRDLYPNCYASLIALSGKFHLHFISHNPDPDRFYEPVRQWLGTYFPQSYFSLTIFAEDNCKVEKMVQDDTAWGIIEDKATTLYRAHLYGFNTIAREHPWNLDTISQFGIMSFTDWAVVPVLVEDRLNASIV